MGLLAVRPLGSVSLLLVGMLGELVGLGVS